LNQFAGKASKLGAAGLAALLGTALALILTIDRTLNSIWRVRTRRPLAQRVLIYWAAITLGPLVLGASLSVTSYALSASKGMVAGLPGGVGFVLDVLQFVLVAGGMAAMFHYVPNTAVRWGHAWMGGLFVASGLEVAKRLLALYLGQVPSYSAVYGAFATVPILLVWIYTVWVIVLLGAALTAHVPSLLAGVARRPRSHGWEFQLALEVLGILDAARSEAHKGLTLAQLCTQLRVDRQHLEPVVESLVALDWLGRLVESSDPAAGARLVLLVDPDATPLEPLLAAMLLAASPQASKLWHSVDGASLNLRSVL
jgi:membrane protein